MELIYSPDTKKPPGPAVIGGKGTSLFRLHNAGLPVPKPLCVATVGYDWYVEHNDLREKISLELYRKEISDMRWEEIWDTSLTIQNLFMKGNMPIEMRREIVERVQKQFGGKPLVIRSSAPAEDGEGRSFAGLHSSYVNVNSSEELDKYIKKVWASLWSDRAILYRQELGLDVLGSTMGIVIQEFIVGGTSGVMFTEDPTDNTRMVIEAVHGLNQGLVDGTVQPDRWILNRSKKEVMGHSSPENRETKITASVDSGVNLQPCNEFEQSEPPLNKKQVEQITAWGMKLEQFHESAIDIEWTLSEGQLHILQVRPITAAKGADSADKRSWYLSLTRSYDNLLQLWNTIETRLLPEMDHDAFCLAAKDLEKLTKKELAEEIRCRIDINEKWTSIYWDDFIPFAHGVRLFGETYNDIIEPDDPFEFVHLLTGQAMLSTERNALLFKCAQQARKSSTLWNHLQQGSIKDFDNHSFQQDVRKLKTYFSMGFVDAGQAGILDSMLASMILEYSGVEQHSNSTMQDRRNNLERLFIEKARHKLPVPPKDLLEMARASYRIRDDDNIHLGRIGQELERAVCHAKKRLQKNGLTGNVQLSANELCKILDGELTINAKPNESSVKDLSRPLERVRARQLQGQAASKGIAKGMARVILAPADLKNFRKGEILVIDSIDPTMTFFAPLAAGIIERRGGMLIHGAIIAREYGIPCITGIVEATSKIHTGEIVTVDGFLGICTVQRPTTVSKDPGAE